MLNVAFLGTFAASLEQEVRQRVGVPCRMTVGGDLEDADVLVTMAFDGAMARGAPRLKLVQVPGAGLDRINRVAVPAGVWLANVYGHETGIAEYVLGAMLSLTREFGRVDAALRRGQWLSQWAVGQDWPPVWPELAGRTLGILGYGHIGRAIARRARAFDMQVLATRRRPELSRDDPHAEIICLDGTDRLLREADYLVIAMPADPDTMGMLDTTRLRLMKPSAFLTNIARGAIIEERVLYKALSSRAIAGAALDVWYNYPVAAGLCAPANLPFHELPNVLMTPHISGWTDGMLSARCRLIADNIARVAAGETPHNLVGEG